jgi:hypothetical protein
MAAITPGSESIMGVSADDVLELYTGIKRELKRVTVEEFLRGTGIAVCASRWDDLRFPAQAINPAGAVEAPTVDQDQAKFPGTLLFAGNKDASIGGIAQMPHSWARGTSLRPHIHWSKPVGSANAVDWKFYYRICGWVGDVAGAWSSAVDGVLAAGDPTVADAHLLTSFGDIPMTDLKESAIVAWRLDRLGVTDADNGVARLYEFDIHFLASQLGTITEIPI